MHQQQGIAAPEQLGRQSLPLGQLPPLLPQAGQQLVQAAPALAEPLGLQDARRFGRQQAAPPQLPGQVGAFTGLQGVAQQLGPLALLQAERLQIFDRLARLLGA